MKLGRKIMNEVKKLFSPPPIYLALAPLRAKTQAPRDWIARTAAGDLAGARRRLR
jgi:hypothetical protein